METKRNEKVDPTEVKYRHIRNYDFNGDISNRGGITIAYREPNSNTIEFAVARCNPSDNFSRKMGRIIATGRLNSVNWRETLNMSFGEFHANIQNLV